jgi:1A family penicillin-binding protein
MAALHRLLIAVRGLFSLASPVVGRASRYLGTRLWWGLVASAAFAWAHRPGARLLAAALASVLTVVIAYLGYCFATLPFGGGLAVDPSPSALTVEADGGEVFATRGVFKGDKLASGDVPADLAHAVVAIEDRRFYHHPGIDFHGMLRAAWRDLTAGGTREGASTITQQLSRMLYLSPERTLRRKVQEAMLALWLEHQIPKDEILVRYLNTAYFGAGVYGVDAAAKRYFGKPAQQLSLNESAMLAGLVRAPSSLAPTRNLDGARARADLVLDAMVRDGAITLEQAEEARRHPAALRLPPQTPPGTNYFLDMLNAEARALLGQGAGDWRIRSTLDLKLQAVAETVVARHLAAEGHAHNVSQVAVVALGPDGAIRAMVGGRNYEESQFNRATQAKRQPGSLFKLFVYLAALHRGYTPDSIVNDRPVRIGNWEPEDYGGRYHGRITLRSAFAHSSNSVAAQLAAEVGIPAVIAEAKKLGVESELRAVPSLALGSAEVNLLEMTRAYAAIGANVSSLPTYSVRSIRRGDQTFHARVAAPRPAPDDPQARAAMQDLLVSVVREGTGKAAQIPGTAAGKTGTTQDYRDAWFIGFTPTLTVGVWVGNDDNAPMKGVTGGSLPAEIWRDVVTESQVSTFAADFSARGRTRSLSMRADEPAETTAPSQDATAPAGAGPIHGVATVLDTGTLEVAGQTIRLAGVEGATGRSAQGLRRYLRRRDIVCEPTSAADRYRCRAGDRDLSEVILLNGGGRASDDAAPELRAAEARAREARIGMWRRW